MTAETAGSLFQSLPRPVVYAHRGASEEYPQNTLLAFEMAVQQGAAGFETDLRLTSDGQVVCFHDAYLDRLSTMSGPVSAATAADLGRARIRHNLHPGQKIPSLLEVLEWLPSAALLNLELKDGRFEEILNIDRVLNLLSKYSALEKTFFSSFSMASLRQVKRAMPSMRTSWITWWNPSTRPPADILAPYFPILWLNPSYIKSAHQAGRMVSVWDPRPEKRIRHYLEHKVDILTGDNPRRLIDAISGK